MSEITNRRFAISTLSKSKINEAYNGELIGNKNTGELLFKTPDGDGISFMENVRKTSNIDKLVTNMQNYGYKDFNIYEATADASLPDLININDEISIPMLSYTANKFTACSILIDVECFEKNISGISNMYIDALANIDVNIYNNDDIVDTMMIECGISDLKNKVFNLKSTATGISISFKLSLPDEYSNMDTRTILHTVMIATNEINE